MAAPRGLVRTAAAGSLASLAVLSALLATARAQPLTPLERGGDMPRASSGRFALDPPFGSKRPSPVLIDVARGARPIVEWHLQLAFQLDHLDLPLIPGRGPGVFAFLGTSTQSLGGLRLHF